jgi:hypothetical protein
VFAGLGQRPTSLPGPLFVLLSQFGDSTLAVIIGFDVQRFFVPFVDHAVEPSATHSSMDTDARKSTIRLGKRPVEPPHDFCHGCSQFIASL